MSIRKDKLLNRRIQLLMIILIGVTGILILTSISWQRAGSAWERNWLAGTPCRAPCWEGITPNRTTVTETLQLLEHNVQIGNLSYFQSDKDAYNEIFWGRWRDNDGGGRIVYDRTASIVSRISLSFPHNFTLGEAIQTYGQPSHVLAMASRNLEKLDETDYILEIYWQSKGIRIEWVQQYPPHRPVIDSNLTSHSVDFFEPSTAGLEHIITLGNPAQLKFLEPWKGFVDFREYCHPADSGGGVDPQACEAKQP
jgi:hypothetical protein